MQRQRRTWTKKAEQDKTASPPPQMPAVDRTEGPDHPAYHADPDADQYKSGDTSSWAEDPHKPMSPESPPPAMPGNLTTDELDHPGTSDFQKTPESPEKAEAAGGGGKQASKEPTLRQLAEQRATLCVRIASALMPQADVKTVENKAFELMDLDDAQLRATASTLKIVAGEEEEEEVEKEMETEAGKKANVEVVARVERLEGAVGKLVKAMSHFFGQEGDESDTDGMSDRELLAYLTAEDTDGDGIDQSKNDYPQGYDVEKMGQEEDEEEMLKAMLEEMDEEMAVTAATKEEEVTEPLAKGESIQSGEGGNVNPDEKAETPQVEQSDGSEKTAQDDEAKEKPKEFIEGEESEGTKESDEGEKEGACKKKAEDEETPKAAENDIDITAGVDPMGLMEETREASADDELMQLYADLDLPKTVGEEPEEEAPVEEVVEETVEEEKEAGKKKAADEPELKPQAKVASSGAKTIGNVALSKEARDEISELEKMWEHAPSVNKVFGLPE